LFLAFEMAETAHLEKKSSGATIEPWRFSHERC